MMDLKMIVLQTLEILDSNKNIKLIKLTRNFGHHKAIYCISQSLRTCLSQI